MNIDVTSETVEIGRPAEQVTDYAFDPGNDPTWIGGIREAEMLTPRPLGLGSRVRRTASFLGRRIEYVMEVVEHVPGRRLGMHAIQSPFPMDVTYRFDGDGGVTRASIRVQGEPRGFYRVAGPLVPVMVRRSISDDLRRLKKIAESTGQP